MGFFSKKIFWWIVLTAVLVVSIWMLRARQPASAPPAPPAVDEAVVSMRIHQADELAGQGQWLEARKIYQEVVERYSDTAFGPQAEAKLNDIGLQAYFQNLSDQNSVAYTVQPGDHLTKIASKYGVTTGTLMAANQLKSDHIRPGMNLRIMQEPWSMLVDKSRNRLFLKAGERVVKTYSVASGKDNSTPVGNFEIVNRLTDPTWYYEGQVEPPGSPDNPLGSRWMGFSAESYGLHGTTDPDTIGQYATLGCLRMHNKDIEEVFELIPVGTVISIIE